MSLYQSSVLKKFLAAQDEPTIKQAYHTYSSYFLDPVIQQNIRDSKEEQFQEGFLRELFVNILGYTINPNPGFNLTTELKNVKGAKKADGAILKDGSALAIIELKGTDTKDLEKVTEQAFNYKNNQPESIYVITSNFEKLRFYIDNAVEHVEFDLFSLKPEQFKLLWLFLQKDNLLGGIPKKVKEESLLEEEKVTKRLYKDYSAFKSDLWNDMCQHNPEINELELYKKSQKLLDRFLFIFFAEDKGLLPPNSISTVVDDWHKLKELDAYRPLYARFKKYFGYMNEGFKGKRHEIHAYNGGLFKTDPLLDGLSITDEVLEKHVLKLTEYDFETEVDTNILGHIFEHSLNDIENVRAQLEGEEIDKSKTRRKKDGVFYTPKHITKYIVDNTVGKLCEEKKAEIGIDEEEFAKGRRGRKKQTIKRLDEQLQQYRQWLLNLKICDPACGSGAFLNQAFEFLLQEHNYVTELDAQLHARVDATTTQTAFGVVDFENDILEKNLYGVDINEESVEIARLSLWLRTAKKGRKLTSLSSNIKVGNSLIDDPAVAGELAFNWQEQFPGVFEQGGFDVVIGNPPYVQSHSLDEPTKRFIYECYLTAEYQINTYAVFMERILAILSDSGFYSVIIPNYWLSTKNDAKLRSSLFLENRCLEILNVYRIFEDATVDTLIVTGNKSDRLVFPKATRIIAIDRKLNSIADRLSSISRQAWSTDKIVEFDSPNADTLISFDAKIELSETSSVADFLDGFQGMKPYEKGKGTPPQTREIMTQKAYHSDTKIDHSYYPLIGAGNVQRYLLRKPNGFIKYGTNLAAPRKPEIFWGPRLLVNRILSKDKIDITYVSETIINNTDVFNFIPKKGNTDLLKPLLGILGSRLCATFFKKSNVNLDRAAFPKLNVNNILGFPIPKISSNSIVKFETCVDQIMSEKRVLSSCQTGLTDLLQSKFPIEKPSKKLQNWPELDFKGFLAELKKKKVKLNLEEEAEWMAYFNKKKDEAKALQDEITRIDREIDQMVYELYGLTEEEIAIVEQE